MRKTTNERQVIELLFEVSLSFRRSLVRAAAAEGLSPPQAALLWELQAKKPMPMSALAEALECDAANVTGLADILERRGLVLRTSGSEDRRVKLVTTTKKGEAVRTRVVDRMLEPPRWLAAIDRADIDVMRGVLERAKAAVGGVRFDAPALQRASNIEVRR